MPFCRWVAGLMLAVGLGAVSAAAAPVNVKTVETSGSGRLTKCRSWLITYTCKSYHHIEVPKRVSVGDSITLDFGSNPKEYDFPVARIAVEGDHCILYSEASGDPKAMDRLYLQPCSAATAER